MILIMRAGLAIQRILGLPRLVVEEGQRIVPNRADRYETDLAAAKHQSTTLNGYVVLAPLPSV